MTNRTKMKVPRGSEGFFFEEAYIHRKVTESLHNLFNSWGYLPVETPVFDLFDVYRSLISEGGSDKIYRLIDRDGDLLMLRSDITLFLARQMGMILSKEDLPVRVCYSDSILRHQDSEDISHNEFFQSGIELIGKPGMEGDLEVLLLLSETLKLLDIPAGVHIGSHALFNDIFRNFSDSRKKQILRFTELREFDQLAAFCAPELGEDPARAAAGLFSFIGSEADLRNLIDDKEAKGEGFSASVRSELEYLCRLTADLRKAGMPEIFTIDLSEAGSQAYHTGIVFQVYMEEVDSAVISGGRYDSLIGKFGIEAPAVGFSLLQRKIEPGIGKIERFASPRQTLSTGEKDIIRAFIEAEKLRKEGKTVIL